MTHAWLTQDRAGRWAAAAIAALSAVSAVNSCGIAAATTGTAFAPWTATPALSATGEYRYTLTARVRPLLVFWITRPGVGSARIVRGEDATGARSYELLIGSDPDRAPMRLNRWGYVAEVARGGATAVVGVMTESEEETVDQARAAIDRPEQRSRYGFKAIRASIAGGDATAEVVRVAFDENYTLRDVRAVLERLPEGGPATARIRVPDGSGRGFLAALAMLIDESVAAARRSERPAVGQTRPFVYDRGVYDLTVRKSRFVTEPLAGGEPRRAVESDFEIRNRTTGNTTGFRLVYATEGPVAGVPLRIVYRPRWWFEAELRLEEGR